VKGDEEEPQDEGPSEQEQGKEKIDGGDRNLGHRSLKRAADVTLQVEVLPCKENEKPRAHRCVEFENTHAAGQRPKLVAKGHRGHNSRNKT